MTWNKMFEDLLYQEMLFSMLLCWIRKAWWINSSFHLESTLFIMLSASICRWEMSKSYSFINWIAMLPSVRFPFVSSTYSLNCVWQSGCACHLDWFLSPPTYHSCIIIVPACSKPCLPKVWKSYYFSNQYFNFFLFQELKWSFFTRETTTTTTNPSVIYNMSYP